MKIEEEIEILENALKGALLVPSECAFVNTQIIKICLDTLKCYESWENLIEYEIGQKVRADTIDEFVTEARLKECVTDMELTPDEIPHLFNFYVEAIANELKEKE